MGEINKLDALNRLLPQTQCRQCGFDGCVNYARAILSGEACINRCAPGGKKGIEKIAAFLGVDPLPLDPEYGKEIDFAVARVDVNRCIGCRLCAAVCPVDAISGVPKHLFSVVEKDCTGCALCVTACPMDAIDMKTIEHIWDEKDAMRAKSAYEATTQRRQKRQTKLEETLHHTQTQKKALLDAVFAKVRKAS